MKVGYVVLYIEDPSACRAFWVDRVGMIEKKRTAAGDVDVVQVGFADQAFALELVPRALMKDNPDGLDLATPSMCFHVDNLEAERTRLIERGVTVSEIGAHGGIRSFAFSDPEGKWFAVSA